ncbi:helix-turn-helix domain-containing protein [Jannaschia sp. LMIT008]|uniref:helix-turn-helix domain-containing protein n=1 Tax=Jannaschia maritima TaxID=3032585 RepID=UPI00281271F8|nr:RodZ domain-containing protein [Jannaschia sp. LMIT008]
MFGRKAKQISMVEQPDRGFDSFEMRLGDEMRGERATIGKSLMDVQRELRIKASYIAAIENADLTVFDSLSFVAGYVRSYARYLGMDPEIVFARFCEESGFEGIKALKPLESEAGRRNPIGIDLGGKTPGMALPPKAPPAMDPLGGAANPFARNVKPTFSGFEPGALGSLAFLAALVGGIGYGGWMLVQEIQRVQVAPIEEAPSLVAELDPLEQAPLPVGGPEVAAMTAADDALNQLYRPRALDAPVLTARDAPIGTIRPGTVGALAQAAGPDRGGLRNGGTDPVAGIGASIDAALLEAIGDVQQVAAADGDAVPPRVLADGPQTVTLVAVRDAWVRVRSADGATLYERTMAAGDTWAVPAEAAATATLRTGNSGALYFAVAGQTYGPVAPGAQVVSDVALAPEAVGQTYAAADPDADRDLARVVAELDLAATAPLPAPVTP